MSKDNKIVSENLSSEQEQTLNALLSLIIPPSEDGKMPGADNVGFLAYIHNKSLLNWIQEGLNNIIEESFSRYGQEFSLLNCSEQTQLIDVLKRKHFRFFSRLTTEVMECYYQHDHVLKAIGFEPRPPFPDGYQIAEGDLTLLEPVYERGKLYRDA